MVEKERASRRSPRRVPLSLRVPEEHSRLVASYAETLTATTRLNVTPSAAGAAILEAGLVALGLLSPAEGAKKGAKPKARKP